MTPRLLRAVAIVLAIVCAIDPAITSTRNAKPNIAVVHGAPSDSVLATRVTHALEKTFTVISAPFTSAAATVIVGSELPPFAEQLASPVFAVLPDRSGATVTIDGVQAPARTPLDARVSIIANLRVSEANGRALDVALQMGDLVVDRVTHTVAANESLVRVPLTFVPAAAGAVPLRVTAKLAGAPAVATDLLVNVREKQWAVLFFDGRPSWMSTFVRRAMERDSRFVVTSRVVTSRNISTDAGHPPSALDDLAEVSLYDVVVVGAPEVLNTRDVAGLDTFLRRRGGRVVLLFDQRGKGAYEQLTQVAQWDGMTQSNAISVNPMAIESGTLRASELIWPARLPAGAETVARTDSSSKNAADVHPVIWQSAVGAGQLIVSGALDAWRFRDSSASGFDRFWQTVIAQAADAAPPPIEVRVTKPLLAPGEVTEVAVTVRDAALSQISSERAVHATVAAAIEGFNTRVNVRLWPSGPVGEFRGTVRAPMTPGSYRVVALAGGAQGDAPMIVAARVAHAAPDERDLVSAWASARGGVALPASRLEEIPAVVTRSLQPQPRLERWHPMRSAWWIVPFALALGGEWWWRRRRGLG